MLTCNSKRTLLALSLAGLLGALTASSASAGFHFGGGHGGFAAPHFSAPRISTPRFSGRSIARPTGGFNRPHVARHVPGQHAHGPRQPRLPHVAHHPRLPKIKIAHHRPGCHHGNCWGPRIPVAVAPPVYTPVRPIYAAPVVTPVVAGPKLPVAAPTKACVVGGTYITIVFQPNASVAAVAGFLKEYDVVMADGPNTDGMFRIRLSSETVPVEKFGEMIDSMKSKTDIVASIAAG